MAGNSLNLMNLKLPKPPAETKPMSGPKLAKVTAGAGFSPIGDKSGTPKVTKPAKATKAKATTTTPTLVGGSGLAGALANKNLV